MYFQSLGPNSLIKQALYYRKTSVSFKSSLSIVYQCSTSQLSFPLFLVSHQHCFSMDSIHMSPLDRPQWPQVRVSPQTIKMVRGLGLRSQVMERMRAVGLLRLKLWTESQSWLKGWKLCSELSSWEMLYSLVVSVAMFWMSTLTTYWWEGQRRDGKEVTWWRWCHLVHSLAN